MSLTIRCTYCFESRWPRILPQQYSTLEDHTAHYACSLFLLTVTHRSLLARGAPNGRMYRRPTAWYQHAWYSPCMHAWYQQKCSSLSALIAMIAESAEPRAKKTFFVFVFAGPAAVCGAELVSASELVCPLGRVVLVSLA